jgi:Asp-tRNA(Asn)/Glu-tRNA(Gln) amidotransferase B subunit
MTKNSESDYFFFPPPESEYFFQQQYFFRKKNIPTLPSPSRTKFVQSVRH